MTVDNPFRQPLRRANVHFKTVIREANNDGKDAGGNTDFAIGKDYLWIAFYFSVPLAWITSVRPLGPGFLIAWRDPIAKREEFATFCILRQAGATTRKKGMISFEEYVIPSRRRNSCLSRLKSQSPKQCPSAKHAVN
jgi:hypothetical protein